MMILPLHSLFESSDAKCTPSSCGNLHNIGYPFRLKGDPKKCGNPRFELACENNVTSLSLNSHKYYVKAINYSKHFLFNNSTIRLVDASINKDNMCSFPTYSPYTHNFTYPYPYANPDLIPVYPTDPYNNDKPFPINFISCPNRLSNSSLIFTDITAHCGSNSSHHHTYAYVKVGRMKVSEMPHTCKAGVMVMTFGDFKNLSNVSLSEIHEALLYGFEFTVNPVYVISKRFIMILGSGGLIAWLVVFLCLLCSAVSPPLFTICGFCAVLILVFVIASVFLTLAAGLLPAKPLYVAALLSNPLIIIDFIIVSSRVTIFPLALWLLICKFRKRHQSAYNTIESYLQSDNKLSPIRYSYSDIKRMTRGFREKLGEGGYGCVYKGKLRSGHDAAVKLLGKSSKNGKDFMNEIATIGRIHHVNVVKLIGYCAQGSKRALIFDFMSNGSLDKYLLNRDKMNTLNWDTKFDIAVGIARGVEYLHRGCDIQILHFDIKPHNILLDDNFIPKISDFGLAKLCSRDKNAVTMTAPRGTIGYVAPELINRSIGVVSYKADVYSYGMLLMEMVSLKRDLTRNNGSSSQYFPYWIYDCFKEGKDIQVDGNEDNPAITKLVRKITIVALWCIQMSPDARPSMNKVLEMLEADVEHLKIPEYPSEPTQIVVNAEETGTTFSSEYVSALQHHEDAPGVEISVQE
ncbi:LEAF RUST 10 DISEASE-RESISTANCE LOCUS RECEPTOR-LIKE PROTEIN KINASE-like 2.4 [Salvia hispanica]|uniref:LEAF RUST 10 DISEASE-RESISTANCE LOCUS RECEPTOR-LIKE PROTEIN KINASE-like 2.4 n=1 Tax=Salvia hispanica TaxID=49212 RepID=UPI002009848F|nr:LEAF RUST 10 DISEASE-RESISTANCE LOCUS RECEPTOR-LIKE PROTEIN KINASE-like 2.4 [Salvia hispanica]